MWQRVRRVARRQWGRQRRFTDRGGHGSTRAGGQTQNSPGILSGNSIQATVDAPVNACGNTVTVIGAGNSTSGNHCSNGSATPPSGPQHPHGPGSPGHSDGPSHPQGPGPHHPPASDHPGGPGDAQDSGKKSHTGTTDDAGVGRHRAAPGSPDARSGPGRHASADDVEAAGSSGLTPLTGIGQLAQTGAGQLGLALSTGTGLLLGGAVLYRRARTSRTARTPGV
ncbi:chaplin [Streptomyces sp. MST-110588]|uniref:chaplin n=1 Tax=Streptomyces sp. MST-110588 TaxID=2833628 RepID=UPI0032420321